MRLNTQKEDKKGISIERRDHEGPEGSNAPSKSERQDTSRPFAAAAIPHHMVAEMQMMKEQIDFMMNALRRRI